MKFLKTLSKLTVLLILISSCKEEEKSNLTLFSDQVPTDTALVFGEGVVSTDAFEFAITFSPEMDEMFFTRRQPESSNEIYAIKLVDGAWSDPELAFFTPEKGWDFEPHINPKGDILYFGSIRPLNDTIEKRELHQWYSEKNANGWSQPVPLEAPFKDRFVMYLTSSANGNLYFTSEEEGEGHDDGGIYNAMRKEGQYGSVNRMGEEINLKGLKLKAHPYIAPDESYIIFDGESDSGFGDNDLYISFNKNGSWTEAQNLGPEINTGQTEMCASVSPDGRYLFFHRGTYIEDEEKSGDIYWIDFRPIMERLKGKTSE
ncbi:PD40 domain-containing protein [Flagellimonas allohymeniacidonis]|uniref:WD40-like Beta Propeller Repeat n=1 Tax=Flagellimonas allohymeniacidonis TaxID=2517819 RepID=A0A4Q8QDI0_9FLAO|nr:PD40 domain-containing protein [Allomuricauda hymeniacidonis]TAI47597.1 hypothetical protein EW142_13105 [Allomuricauda hymeniacidonis]